MVNANAEHGTPGARGKPPLCYLQGALSLHSEPRMDVTNYLLVSSSKVGPARAEIRVLCVSTTESLSRSDMVGKENRVTQEAKQTVTLLLSFCPHLLQPQESSFGHCAAGAGRGPRPGAGSHTQAPSAAAGAGRPVAPHTHHKQVGKKTTRGLRGPLCTRPQPLEMRLRPPPPPGPHTATVRGARGSEPASWSLHSAIAFCISMSGNSDSKHQTRRQEGKFKLKK